jgi:hypothetical protein
VALVSGLVLIGLGTLLLFDQTEVIDLTPGLLGASLAGVIGVILLASGLNGQEDAGDEAERERDSA